MSTGNIPTAAEIDLKGEKIKVLLEDGTNHEFTQFEYETALLNGMFIIDPDRTLFWFKEDPDTSDLDGMNETINITPDVVVESGTADEPGVQVITDVQNVTVRWVDGYMEIFSHVDEVRFSSTLLFIAKGTTNRHIPLVGNVRWYSLSVESHDPPLSS